MEVFTIVSVNESIWDSKISASVGISFFLKDILKTGANDVYVIQPKSGKEILIPAIKEVVKKVDLENAKMYIELPVGIE